MVCNAAMHYFGERAGDPARDPELVFRHLTTTIGGTAETYLQRYQDILTRALAEFDRVRSDGSGDMRMVSSARAWLNSTTMALARMCVDVSPRLPEGSIRDEAAAWCAVLPRIDAVRRAAAASRSAPPVSP
jgi:hypothetical protein